MPETEALSKRVKAIRKASNMTQEEFASKIGMSTEEVSLIERKTPDVKLSTMKKIAAFTGCTVSELVYFVTDGPETEGR